MLITEISHPRGAVLDVPFLWLLIAMLNFLRLRNNYADVRGLRMTCVGANCVALTLEVLRFKMFGAGLEWGPYPLIAALGILGEAIFSLVQRNGSGSSA
jgi:hypothetical protein